MLFGFVYVYFVGIVLSGVMVVIYDFVNWVYLVLIGFYIMVNVCDYFEYCDVLLFMFMWGMFVMGLYGIV